MVQELQHLAGLLLLCLQQPERRVRQAPRHEHGSDLMSHCLNSLKGVLIGDYISGTTIGLIKGDARSLDSYEVMTEVLRRLGSRV